MASYKLKIYEISCKLAHPPKDAGDDPVKFYRGDSQHDLFAIISSMLKVLHKQKKNVDIAKYFRTTKQKNIHRKAINIDKVNVRPKYGIISGVALYGDYGRTGSIREVATNAEKHSKTVSQADMEPYYFRFHIVDGLDVAIFMTLSISGSTLRLPMEKILKNVLRRKNYIPAFRALTDDATVREFLSYGELIQLRGIAHKRRSEDRAMLVDSVVGGNTIGAGTRIEIALRKLGKIANSTLEKAKLFWEDEISQDELISIPGIEELDEVLAQIKYEGTTRTIPIHEQCDIAITYDCDDLKRGADGHIPFGIIDKYADMIWETHIQDIIVSS